MNQILKTVILSVLALNIFGQTIDFDRQIRLLDVESTTEANEVLMRNSDGVVVKRTIEDMEAPTGIIISDKIDDPYLLDIGYELYGSLFSDIALAPPEGELFGRWRSMRYKVTNTRRIEHTATWTSEGMFIFGGLDYDEINAPLLYRPSTDTWISVDIVGAPMARRGHTATELRNSVYIYGGQGNPGVGNTFYKYDPSFDNWEELAPFDSNLRSGHTAVKMTDGKMIIYGGNTPELAYHNSGAIYDPDTELWTDIPISPTIGRSDHQAVWDNLTQKMYVFGGYDNTGYAGTAISFHPSSNTWEILETPPSFSPRVNHTATSMGGQILIFGGTGTHPIYDNWVYSPHEGASPWEEVTDEDSPGPRPGHTADFTGTAAIIWGGIKNIQEPIGKKYVLSCKCWKDISEPGQPSSRGDHSSVWTGSELIIWGGTDYITGRENDGAIYNANIPGVGPLSYSELFLYKKE